MEGKLRSQQLCLLETRRPGGPAGTVCSDAGRSLVTIDSSTENSALVSASGSHLSACASSGELTVHIGLNKVANVTQWHSGDPVSYTNILDSDDGGEASWRLYVSGGTGTVGGWYDNQKTAEFAYICE